MVAKLVTAGIESLWDYIALHTVTCLIPAFFLAGAMVSFVSKEVIIHYLGIAAKKIQSFALAAGGSFFISACSCKVIPVAIGLYYLWSGIGPAFILLWVAPAANILALVYTGAILGYDMAAVRLLAALLMAFIVGTVLTVVFAKEERQRDAKGDGTPTSGKLLALEDIVLLGLIVVTLLAPNYLIQKGPYWQKLLVWGLGTVITTGYALKVKTREALTQWLKETWWFVRIIFPLLLMGVFIVGVVGAILPEPLIKKWLGGSSLSASFFATLIGAISYFATMTEAPFVDTLMKHGMGKGPALALLLTGPGLSLPNMLAIIRVFGFRKALVYTMTLIVLGTIAGFVAGNFIF